MQPLLRQALRLVAHPTIRNRGTTVGSLAHADPAGEMTAVLALCGGSVTAVSSRGRRVIAAADFFLGPLESALAADELAVDAFFPALPTNAGTAFVEIARRHGDYALCGVGAIAELDPAGRLDQPALRLPVGLRRAAGARRHRSPGAPARTMPPSRPAAPSIRRPICTQPPTTAGISPVS